MATHKVPTEVLDQVVDGWHHDPHSILGPHPDGHGIVIRVLRPWAKSVSVLINGQRHSLAHEYRGVWIGRVAGSTIPQYSLVVDYGDGEMAAEDPYRFSPTIGEMDLHLFGEGRHEQLWNFLGAHAMTHQGVIGIRFSVWAPNAQGVRVIGDFNHWDGLATPMRSMGSSGVWEIFIPLVIPGTLYRFSILGRDGNWRTKSDPMAYSTEVPPANASKVFRSNYSWQDDVWMDKRRQVNPHDQAMSIYEVHLGSWMPGLNYLELSKKLVDYVKEHGFTHIEFMPVAEHPYAPSWGYQVTSYYAPTARFGNPDEFRHLVDACHLAEIGVIMDWVPAHFPKDDWALARFDGSALYEHANPKRGEHPDWGTLVFDFGRNEVRNFLVANALYWLTEFHIDGLRVDAVSSMLYLDYSREDGQWEPNVKGGRENLEAVQFLQEVTATVYGRVPGAVMIAEESTAWSGVTSPTEFGGLGFGYKWNMGWMHDSLEYIKEDPVHRMYHHGMMTFSLVYAWSENFILPISHDEVVHGKGSLYGRMPGDHWQKLANVRAYLSFMWAHPGKQLIFMGTEFGQPDEWSESKSLDWHLTEYEPHRGLQSVIKEMNHIYRTTSALWQRDNEPGGFEWLIGDDSANNVFAWARHGHDGKVLVSVTNFSPVVREKYQLPLPKTGKWHQVLNTDDLKYGGSGVGNVDYLDPTAGDYYGKPASALVTLPPLATCWYVQD